MKSGAHHAQLLVEDLRADGRSARVDSVPLAAAPAARFFKFERRGRIARPRRLSVGRDILEARARARRRRGCRRLLGGHARLERARKEREIVEDLNPPEDGAARGHELAPGAANLR